MGEFCRDLFSYIDHMGRGEWFFIAAVGLVIGILCMRGLGSRSSY
jgi:hypothetical protein